MLHNSIIPLLVSLLIVSLYKKFLPQLPFDLYAMGLMQLPVTFVIFRINGVPLNYNSIYESVHSIATFMAGISVFIVFVTITAYNKQVNKNN
ncbi:MAG: hypothetical protein OQK09_08445 [Colwellia sp.]|nr:hypothetical protein [Colwellia sp.]MCW8864606.1 hypothetical protein [Colwellia sp.]MCW9081528.1 hypothetical protein [Colwellia sp.]